MINVRKRGRGERAEMISWRVRRVAETGSTNADLVTLAAAGEPEGAVLAADHQTAGRGRLGRTWQAPPGTGLAVSLLLRPSAPAHRWPWLPLLAGVVVVEALRAYPGSDAVLKWPNDVLFGSAKAAGILVERIEGGPSGAAAVVGVGLNVAAAPEGAASLLSAGFSDVSRDKVLTSLLDAFGSRYDQWSGAAGDPEPWLRPAYRALCTTLGRPVRADVPGRASIVGQAVDVDSDGRLVVRTDIADVSIGAGDVEHVRTAQR
jgi:BirA family transcriptional regulator, biotin operon repressor / biotin---[acetyl-CoA-carboxylase] ligase